MVRPAQDQLSAVLDRLRSDARAVAAAAVAAVSPRVLVPAALAGVAADVLATPGPLAVVAAGKAAAAMHAAFADTVPGAVTASLAVGPHRPDDWAGGAWVTGGHPFATDGSVEAARRALEVARSVDPRRPADPASVGRRVGADGGAGRTASRWPSSSRPRAR